VSTGLALEGVVVVDEGSGPLTGLATMVLADFGARVISLEPPDGDPARAQAAAPLWLRGKLGVTIDARAPGAGERYAALARHADVWVRGPALADGAPADEVLAAENPRLVIGWVTAFGRRGPYAAYPAHEALVAAKAGRMLQFRGQTGRDGPVYAALQVATHAASQSLLAGVLAALRARERDGAGQVIETSLLRGLMPYDVNGVLALQAAERRRVRGEPEPPPDPDPAVAMPTLAYHPLPTRDGRWLQMGNLLPHLFANYVRAAGLGDALAALGVSGPAANWPEDRREAFRDAMLLKMLDKPLDEWQRSFVADGGVASHPYQSTQQALDDADMIANGHSVPMGEGGRQIGLLANLVRTPGRVGGPMPRVGEHTREVFDEIASRASTRRSDGAPIGAPALRRPPPLDGVTVVEAATVIAAPYGAALLADLGARVIKIEPPEGDPFRTMAPGLGAVRVNTGKECIALDLKQPDAQRVARTLIARADVFIHNYRPGVPERLGIGYAPLAALNPRLVYLSSNGYGPAGPGARRPSTHPIPGAALGGVLHQIGGPPPPCGQDLAALREAARRLMRANEVNPDPNTSLVVCSAALLGLAARERTGAGQEIFVDMFGANGYANFDDALAYPGKPERVSPDRDGFGLHPLWRLYRCASGWVMLAIGDAREWGRLRERLRGEGRFALGRERDAVPGRGIDAVLGLDFDAARAGGDALADALARMFARADASAWEALLAPFGVGCVQADASTPDRFFLEDPQSRAEGLLVPARHPPWGEYLRHGAQVVFHGTPGRCLGTACVGEHTDALLAEIGVGADERARLRAAGAVA